MIGYASYRAVSESQFRQWDFDNRLRAAAARTKPDFRRWIGGTRALLMAFGLEKMSSDVELAVAGGFNPAVRVSDENGRVIFEE